MEVNFGLLRFYNVLHYVLTMFSLGLCTGFIHGSHYDFCDYLRLRGTLRMEAQPDLSPSIVIWVQRPRSQPSKKAVLDYVDYILL